MIIEQDLLEEAIRRYPVGTMFYPILNSMHTREKGEFPLDKVTGKWYWASGTNSPACYALIKGPSCLYLDGVWARIETNLSPEIY